MRNFDNYEQIHDNEGNLLIGKLVFCRKGTTTPEPVYAWDSEHNDYVAINPEVLININGRPDQQIFLSDTDYTIYVYKYIGNGEMDQDSDENNWLSQYSFNNLYLTFVVDIKTDSPYLVSNMAELQETAPDNVGVTAGKTLVCLGGYNALGDCPPVFYYWDETNTKTSNGVDVVAVTGISVGRWLLVNTFTETGFDVRHAGCFAEKTKADANIQQSYAIQRADTYALKYGIKIIFPDLFSDTYSYYLLTNLIVNSEVVIADGVKLLTATSATLNFVSEENLKKKVPFINHDDTYSGKWNVTGETIKTSYFENEEEDNDTNWPPTITANKKYIYDASFDCKFSTPNILLSEKEVSFELLLEKEVFELTNCKIESLEKIKKPCHFTNCEIKGSFFDDALTHHDIWTFNFSNCRSDITTWKDINNYVMFKAVNGDYVLDLEGKTCSIDFENDGENYPFPFWEVHNSVFSSNTTLPCKLDGTNEIAFEVENSTFSHLQISENTDLLLFNAKNSNISFDMINYGTLPNCVFNAYDCNLGNDELDVKEFTLMNCKVNCIVGTDTSTNVAKAVVKNCIVSQLIIVGSKSTYNVVFDGNTLKNGAYLRFSSHGSSNHSFVNTSICNNNVADGPREFVENSDANWNYADIGNYEYKNNTGTIKAEDSIKIALRLYWYSYGATIPDGVKRYLHQESENSNTAFLKGVSIKDLLFSFGEDTTRDILARTDPNITSISLDYSFLNDFSSNGTRVNSGTFDNVGGCVGSALYRKGIAPTKEVFDGSFTDDFVFVAHNGMTDGDTCSIVLMLDKVHTADSNSEIIK